MNQPLRLLYVFKCFSSAEWNVCTFSIHFFICSDLLKAIQNTFTELSHHMKVTCLLLSQNLFFQDRIYRNLSLNSHILIIFKSPRDLTQISTLARQISPSPLFIVQSFLDATKNGHGYLLLDFRQKTPDIIRYRTNILPTEMPIVVYKRKNRWNLE